MKPQLTVIVPALNEEDHIDACLDGIRRAAGRNCREVETIVIDDGSRDKTGEIARKKASLVIRHESPEGMGKGFFDGLARASGAYVVLIPGDNEIEEETVDILIGAVGRADIVNTYPINPEVRPLGRRILSRVFIALTRLASGTRLNYFNGPTIYRTDLTKICPVKTWGFGFNAEMLSYQIAHGASVEEIPMRIRPQPGRKSRALRLSNWLKVSQSLLSIAMRRFFSAKISG